MRHAACGSSRPPCDGPATITPEDQEAQAIAKRLYPGEGAFPLVDLFSLISPDMTLGGGVPNRARQQRGMSSIERARDAPQLPRFATLGLISVLKPSGLLTNGVLTPVGQTQLTVTSRFAISSASAFAAR